MYIVRNGQQIELTNDEIMMCYREQQIRNAREKILDAMDVYLSETEYSILKDDTFFLDEAAKELVEQSSYFNFSEAISNVFDAASEIVIKHLKTHFTEEEWLTLGCYYGYCLVDKEVLPSLEYADTIYPNIPTLHENLFTAIAKESILAPEQDIWPEETHTFIKERMVPILTEIDRKTGLKLMEEVMEVVSHHTAEYTAMYTAIRR